MQSPIPPLIGMGSRDLVCAWLHGCLHETSPYIHLHSCKYGLHQGRSLSVIEGWVVELVCVEGSWDVSGSYPLQLQGRPTCPRGRGTHTKRERWRYQASSVTHQRSSQDIAESREEREPGGPTKKEAEVGVNP